MKTDKKALKEQKRLLKKAKLENKKPKPKPKYTPEYIDNTLPGEKKNLKVQPNSYDPAYVESSWYAWWQAKKFFTPKNVQPYVILMPPPNITGKLHLGHAMMISIQDALVRYKRMMGYGVLYLPGTDHAGIATQSVVEKSIYKKKKLTRKDLSRDELLNHAWEWKEKYGGAILDQIKRMGASCDFKRLRFTMDENASKSVTEAFCQLYEKGLIYRENKLVNWCAKLGTTLSDLEVENLSVKPFMKYRVDGGDYCFGVIYYIKYLIVDDIGRNSDHGWKMSSNELNTRTNDSKISNNELTTNNKLDYELKERRMGNATFVEIATTRPETILGDTAICVHPKDKRYQHLKGKCALNPLTGEAIPVISDSYVDPSFGTGVLKVTPAHDPNDYEIGRRNNLRIVKIFDEENRIVIKGAYEGLQRYEARKRIVEDLERQGLLVRKEGHPQNIPICSRSGDVVEPLLKKQWFLKCDGMAKRALEAVKSGEIKISPPEAVKTWIHWLDNIKDWCLSRQLWWGHRIPAFRVYFNESEIGWVVARSKKEALEEAERKYAEEIIGKTKDKFYEEAERNDSEGKIDISEKENFEVTSMNGLRLVQDEDVLDTWFSSGLWPFSVFNWPSDTEDLKRFFPSSVLETGSDILFFWVARMVMLSLELTDQIPFKEILLHGIVRDAHGRKMSKSLGNVIDPLYVIEGITLESLHESLLLGNLDEKEIKKARQGQKKDFPAGIPVCGADALRFTLLSYVNGLKDVNMNVLQVEGYRKFCNKLWNAFKFVKSMVEYPFVYADYKLFIEKYLSDGLTEAVDNLSIHKSEEDTKDESRKDESRKDESRKDESRKDGNTKDENNNINNTNTIEDDSSEEERLRAKYKRKEGKDPAVLWILGRRNKLVKNVKNFIEEYNFLAATREIHNFILYSFCDVFIEIVKKRKTFDAVICLYVVFMDALKVLHPFMPFITEEIYQRLRIPMVNLDESITVSRYPHVYDIEVSDEYSMVSKIAKTLRSILNANGIAKCSVCTNYPKEYISDVLFLCNAVTDIHYTADVDGDFIESVENCKIGIFIKERKK